MIASKTLIVSTAIFLVTTMPAYADARDDKIAAMEAQMHMMMQEIQSMKAERAAEKAETTALKQKLQMLEMQTKTTEAKIENAVANIAPAAGEPSADGVNISMKGSTPKITKGDFSWQPTGRIHLDAGAFADDEVDHPDGAEFRRARLGMQGKVSKDFGYKAEVDFANEGVAIKDMYMNYTGIDKTEIRVGHFKPGYSLEDMTSSNDITFIERSAAVEPFSLSEQIGAGVIHHGQNHQLAVGVFNDDAGVQSSDDEQISVSGRLVGTPYREGDRLVHLGGSVSYRVPDQANDRVDYDSRAENRLQAGDSVSAVVNNVDRAIVYAAEAAAAAGPFSVQGEYVVADIDRYDVTSGFVDPTNGSNPTYNGGYVQAAYTLTGESRSYSTKKGAFGGIKPEHPFDPSMGDWGAVEVAARYSHLDLNDDGLDNGQLETVTVGANWYLNDYMRLMFNIIMVDTDDNAVTADDDPTIFLTRTQVKF